MCRKAHKVKNYIVYKLSRTDSSREGVTTLMHNSILVKEVEMQIKHIINYVTVKVQLSTSFYKQKEKGGISMSNNINPNTLKSSTVWKSFMAIERRHLQRQYKY